MFNINILSLLLAILLCFKLIQDIVYSSLFATIILPPCFNILSISVLIIIVNLYIKKFPVNEMHVLHLVI